MLQISAQHKIYIGIQPIDFRRGIDGIAALCWKQFQLDPQSGHCFIFRNRRGNAIKLLTFDAQGYWLCYKRLSKGRFTGWPREAQPVVTLTLQQLQVLLSNAG